MPTYQYLSAPLVVLSPVTAFSVGFGNLRARKGRHGNDFERIWGRSSVGQSACLSRRRPRVRVPSLPPILRSTLQDLSQLTLAVQ